MARSWGDIARSALETVHRNLPEDILLADRIKAVDAAYPFGSREYWPYKAWLKARKAYLVRFGYRPRGFTPDTPLFPDWQRDPTTGRPLIP